jgi:Collagen triple helix repeat (20 copies)
MRRPVLPLIATTAAFATAAIAVPALAASGSPTAHTARARHCSTVIVISHGRRTRACLVQGPRGFTGFPGAKGTTGKTGKTGATGKTGPAGKNGTNGTNGAPGAPGTARAYAVVTPAATVVTAQSSNIVTVSSPKAGVYCITPAAPISPSADTAVVSPEVSYSTPEAPGLIALNAQSKNCTSSSFEVDTYAPSTLTLAGGYAFTIAIP